MASSNSPLTNFSHIWMLLTLFFASAQAFNSVLPERGLLHWLFSFFFLWTLWNNLFSWFDARRLLHSLAVLFGTAFVLKHLLLAGLYSQEQGWLQRVAGALLQESRSARSTHRRLHPLQATFLSSRWRCSSPDCCCSRSRKTEKLMN